MMVRGGYHIVFHHGYFKGLVPTCRTETKYDLLNIDYKVVYDSCGMSTKDKDALGHALVQYMARGTGNWLGGAVKQAG
jgi:hypothetical protein